MPSTKFDFFLGGSYDLAAQTVKLTAKRVVKIMAAATSFQNSPYKTARDFMSLIGLLNAPMNQVRKLGRMNIRPIQWHLGRYWSNNDPLYKHHSDSGVNSLSLGLVELSSSSYGRSSPSSKTGGYSDVY